MAAVVVVEDWALLLPIEAMEGCTVAGRLPPVVCLHQRRSEGHTPRGEQWAEADDEVFDVARCLPADNRWHPAP